MKKVSLPIIGMHCASCARLIEKKLIKTDGVIVAGVLSVFIFLGSFPEWFAFVPPFLTNPIVLLLLTLPVQFWAGFEFYQATISGIKNRAASMDTLIAVGTTAAFGYSVFSILGVTKGTYFD